MRPFLTFLVLLCAAVPALAKEPKPGDFDYFVLALSWSPTYCATARDDEQQCNPQRNFDFVVHGLWPQYARGWPEYCDTRKVWVDEDVIDTMLPIMPSKRLVIHQWKKHGSCVGLKQADYFRAIRVLREKVKTPARYVTPNADIVTTPAQLVADFVKTNAGLRDEMISVQCGGGRDRARLVELRICLDRRGNFAACGANENRSCRAASLVMPRSRQ